MKTSFKRCPECNTQLFVTNSARYWCTECQCEKRVSLVDRYDRDLTRKKILIEMILESSSFNVLEDNTICPINVLEDNTICHA